MQFSVYEKRLHVWRGDREHLQENVLSSTPKMLDCGRQRHHAQLSAWPHTQTHTETHTHTNKHMHTHTGPGSVAFIELQWSLFLSFPKCEAVAQGDCRRSDCNSYFNQLLALGVSLLSQLIKTWIGRRSVYVPMNQCNGILHKSTDTKSNILMNFWRNVAQSALENTTCTF